MSYILNNESEQKKQVTASPGVNRDQKERKHPCLQCDFRFLSKGDLHKHTNTVHLKIRNHICPICGTKFAEKGNLTKHEKRHEGLREFQCEFPGCPKTFVLRDGLARHRRSVHGVADVGGRQKAGGGEASRSMSSSKSKAHSYARGT